MKCFAIVAAALACAAVCSAGKIEVDDLLTTTVAVTSSSEMESTTSTSADESTSSMTTMEETTTEEVTTTSGEVTTTTTAPPPCSELASCSACASRSDCTFCSGKLDTTMTGKDFPSMYGLGQCIDKSTETCDDVKFGDLEDFLDFSVLSSLFVSQWTVVELPSGNPHCTDVEWAKQPQAPTCEACVSEDFGGGWCNVGASVPDFAFATKGGMCVPKSFGFFCNSEIIPPFDGVNFEANYTATVESCTNYVPPPTPSPSPKCVKNRSCDTCNYNDDCTWCGVELDVGDLSGLSLMSGMTVKAFGKCVEGKSNTCKDVHFGTIDVLAAQDPDLNLKVAPVSKADAWCTNVMWPANFMVPTCDACTSNAKLGWCEFGEEVEGEVYSAGMCMHNSWQFTCNSNLMPHELNDGFQTQWSTDASTCGPIVPSTTTSTVAPHTLVPPHVSTTAKTIAPPLPSTSTGDASTGATTGTGTGTSAASSIRATIGVTSVAAAVSLLAATAF